MDQTYGYGGAVADARPDVRAEFLRKTYLHLGLAIAAFIAVEAALLQIPGVDRIVHGMTGMAWLVVLLLFMAVSHIADGWARSATSLTTQYAGLGLYVLAEAVVFLPLLYGATRYAGPGVIANAGVLTGITFGGLSAIVFFSKSDFSVLGTGLRMAGMVALGLIVCSILFGLSLGIWFSLGMIVLASGSILYSTDAMLRSYRPDQPVAAALTLFASVALLFFYILRLMMQLRR